MFGLWGVSLNGLVPSLVVVHLVWLMALHGLDGSLTRKVSPGCNLSCPWFTPVYHSIPLGFLHFWQRVGYKTSCMRT